MKPRFGVKVKDTSPKPTLKTEIKGGLYESNPDLPGKKLSKLSYTATHKSGL
jgi:hypothetical protein